MKDNQALEIDQRMFPQGGFIFISHGQGCRVYNIIPFIEKRNLRPDIAESQKEIPCKRKWQIDN